MSNAWSGGSDSRWRNFRAYILGRDRYLCRVGGPRCAGAAPLDGGHVDHIVPLSMGGAKFDESNARASCETCNTGRRVAAARVPQAEPRPVSRW